MKSIKYIIIIALVGISCDRIKNEVSPSHDTMYFPPVGDNTWATQSINSLGWNQSALLPLKQYLSQKNTKAFLILVNGRIVVEEYFDRHTSTTPWAWNSVGKTLVATTTGIAQQENLLNINDKASKYLGEGWTSVPLPKENLITNKHLLNMTSGLDEEKQLVIKTNLTYVADAGTRWAYANVFQKLMDIVAKASNQDFETYFNAKLKNKIGMDGQWNNGIIFKIYNSTARSMARFGILTLNKGLWNNDVVVNPAFFEESTTSSQNINPSYGYLWWLNGKQKYMLPSQQTVYNDTLVPNAPKDMYAAMGAMDQRLYIIPSKQMVIVRMGDAANPQNPYFALSNFDNELWGKVNELIGK